MNPEWGTSKEHFRNVAQRFLQGFWKPSSHVPPQDGIPRRKKLISCLLPLLAQLARGLRPPGT
eukprot:1143049-Pelagomonas_calceolata.AAC.2